MKITTLKTAKCLDGVPSSSNRKKLKKFKEDTTPKVIVNDLVADDRLSSRESERPRNYESGASSKNSSSDQNK